MAAMMGRSPSEAGSLSRKVVIAHVDLDAFYTQVEVKRRPSLKNKPVVVVQYNPFETYSGDIKALRPEDDRLMPHSNGSIIACSYEARAFGVKRNMFGQPACKLCPELQIVQVPTHYGKADLSIYRHAGAEVASILSRCTVCERASIDEVYLDVTEEAMRRLELCPADQPPPMPASLEGIHVAGFKEDAEQPGSGASAWWQQLAGGASFNDRLLAAGAAVVSELRAAVAAELGFTCSAGVAHYKILAKLGSGLHKPAQQTVVPAASVPGLLGNLPISKLRQLGGKYGENLKNAFGISTVGELAALSMAQLESKVGEEEAGWLQRLARGIDSEEVKPRMTAKSVSCSKTFKGPHALRSLGAVHRWLLALGEELEERLREDRALNDREPQLMTVGLMTEALGHVSRSSSLRRATAEALAEDGTALIKKWAADKQNWRITSLSMGVSNFTAVPTNVPAITTFFKPSTAEQLQPHPQQQQQQQQQSRAQRSPARSHQTQGPSPVSKKQRLLAFYSTDRLEQWQPQGSHRKQDQQQQQQQQEEQRQGQQWIPGAADSLGLLDDQHPQTHIAAAAQTELAGPSLTAPGSATPVPASTAAGDTTLPTSAPPSHSDHQFTSPYSIEAPPQDEHHMSDTISLINSTEQEPATDLSRLRTPSSDLMLLPSADADLVASSGGARPHKRARLAPSAKSDAAEQQHQHQQQQHGNGKLLQQALDEQGQEGCKQEAGGPQQHQQHQRQQDQHQQDQHLHQQHQQHQQHQHQQQLADCKRLYEDCSTAGWFPDTSENMEQCNSQLDAGESQAFPLSLADWARQSQQAGAPAATMPGTAAASAQALSSQQTLHAELASQQQMMQAMEADDEPQDKQHWQQAEQQGVLCTSGNNSEHVASFPGFEHSTQPSEKHEKKTGTATATTAAGIAAAAAAATAAAVDSSSHGSSIGAVAACTDTAATALPWHQLQLHDVDAATLAELPREIQQEIQLQLAGHCKGNSASVAAAVKGSPRTAGKRAKRDTAQRNISSYFASSGR